MAYRSLLERRRHMDPMRARRDVAHVRHLRFTLFKRSAVDYACLNCMHEQYFLIISEGVEVMNGRRSGVPQQSRPGAFVYG